MCPADWLWEEVTPPLISGCSEPYENCLNTLLLRPDVNPMYACYKRPKKAYAQCQPKSKVQCGQGTDWLCPSDWFEKRRRKGRENVAEKR